VTQVLGTRLFAFERDVPEAFLISDLHVPADGGAAFGHLQSAVACAISARAALLILGDLFDSYVCRAQVRHGIWREVANLLASARTAGVAVELLHGNRDFLLGPEFAAATGAAVFAGGRRGVLGGVDTLLLHGDELCQNDLPYQRAKRWLRHPLTRAVARSLPLRVALGVAERARKKSQMVIQSGDQTRFLPTRRALGEAMASGASRLVFGHIHRFAHGREAGGEYWVLPAFDATGVGLRCAGGTGEPVRFRPGGSCERVADPQPLAFPP
jgi:UDP-2,3-diacylglucosamine hydrolase